MPSPTPLSANPSASDPVPVKASPRVLLALVLGTLLLIASMLMAQRATTEITGNRNLGLLALVGVLAAFFLFLNRKSPLAAKNRAPLTVFRVVVFGGTFALLIVAKLYTLAAVYGALVVLAMVVSRPIKPLESTP